MPSGLRLAFGGSHANAKRIPGNSSRRSKTMSLEHCRIVLIETHYPGNLGATARVMCNFGLGDLVLVSPVADRNERDARRMSTHGETVLNNARIVTDLSEAINDCVLVV